MAGLFGHFRRKRRAMAPALTRAQATAARPIRNPALSWHENEHGFAVVTLSRRRDLTGKVLASVFMVPESRPLVLDEVGTLVWKLCDGEHSFQDLVMALSREYSITQREAEVSMAEFMRLLGRRGMIAFILPKEIAAELTPQQRRELGVQEAEEPEESQRPACRRKGEDADETGAAAGGSAPTAEASKPPGLGLLGRLRASVIRRRQAPPKPTGGKGQRPSSRVRDAGKRRRPRRRR
jgi:hypothetical protein